jgi:hypothetical protein
MLFKRCKDTIYVNKWFMYGALLLTYSVLEPLFTVIFFLLMSCLYPLITEDL